MSMRSRTESRNGMMILRPASAFLWKRPKRSMSITCFCGTIRIELSRTTRTNTTPTSASRGIASPWRLDAPHGQLDAVGAVDAHLGSGGNRFGGFGGPVVPFDQDAPGA